MGSSPGFGSSPTNIVALLRLAFTAVPPQSGLTLTTGGEKLAGSFFNRHGVRLRLPKFSNFQFTIYNSLKIRKLNIEN